MRVLEEVQLFLRQNISEVVFLSCVPDEGVVGETFCRVKAISASELDFCVAAALGDFLGPKLHQDITIKQLIDRLAYRNQATCCCCFCCCSFCNCETPRTAAAAAVDAGVCTCLGCWRVSVILGDSEWFCCGLIKNAAFPTAWRFAAAGETPAAAEPQGRALTAATLHLLRIGSSEFAR